MPRCIYCLNDGTQFNSEHVIPRCAIKSIKDAPALHGEVCVDCNTFFSHLDSIASPLTLTSVLTALDGANTKWGDMENFGLYHYALRLRTRRFPMLDGARCFISSTAASGYTMHLEPRVVLMKRGKGFDVFRPESIPTVVNSHMFRIRYSGQGLLMTLADTKLDLGTADAKFQLDTLDGIGRQLALQVVRQGFEHQVNKAIAKMAFNFVAWIAGRRKYNKHKLNLYDHSFDAVRHFIRAGSLCDEPLVERQRYEFERRRKPLHFIRLTTEIIGGNNHLVAYVGLFELAQWRVQLAEIEAGAFRYDIRYDWDFAMKGCTWMHKRDAKLAAD